jgi:hypothetical protein
MKSEITNQISQICIEIWFLAINSKPQITKLALTAKSLGIWSFFSQISTDKFADSRRFNKIYPASSSIEYPGSADKSEIENLRSEFVFIVFPQN